MKSNRLTNHGARMASVFCVLAALAPTCRMFAQTTSTPIKEEDVIELSPWDVTASADEFYRDKMAVTAAGVVASVRETPLSIDIITSEQLRDTGVNDFIDAFRGTAGISTQPDDILNPSANFKIRGFSAGRFLRNGYVKYYFQNLDGVDRIEVVRGPVAAFYGQAEPGGVVNYITKKPLFKWQQSVRFTYGSNDFYKVWVDSTGPIIKDMLAYRVVATYQNSGSWKQYVTNERPYLLAALRFKPFEKLQFDFDYEYNLNRQRGAVRSALVANTDYLADYSKWQNVAENLKFSNYLNSNNRISGGLPSADYSPYNLNFFTRYPKAYSLADNLTKSQLATLLKERPWMDVGYVDPRTGLPQQPIIEREPGFGVRANGELQNRDFSELTVQQYRHGWSTLTMFEKIGAYDPSTGKFTQIDMNAVDPTKSMAEPSLTGLVFPQGTDFNPNGPGAWYYDESHVATGEMKFEATDWLNFKFGSNYYENWSKQIQQYNSDTDQDGYTLDAGQGFPNGSSGTTSGATGFGFFNRRWVHQLSADINFEVGETKHNILLTGEYRDDYFMMFNPVASDVWGSAGGLFTPTSSTNPRQSPGFANWDIFNDPAPNTNEWASDQWVYNGASNATIQTGYGASYRVKLLDDKMQFWTGVRHERQEQYVVTASGDRGAKSEPVTGTTPMYGISYTLFNKTNIYASYSESFISRSLSQNNRAYRDPFKVINNPALAAYLNDPINAAKPDVSTVSIDNFQNIDASPLHNPKGVGYEIGIKQDLEGEYGFLSYTSAVFHLERQGLVNQLSGSTDDMKDEIARIKNYYPTLVFPEPSAIYSNSGKEESEGVEVNVTYVPVENLQITASFSYLFKKQVSSFDDAIMYGNKLVPPGTTSPSNGSGPIPNPTLYYFDKTAQVYLPKWPSNKDTIQEEGELTDPTVISEDVRLQQAKDGGFDYYPEVYLPKYTPELNNVPDLQFNLQARYDFRDGFLKGARAILSYSYEGDSPVSVGGATSGTYVRSPFRNPEVHLFDGTIGYKLPIGDTEVDIALTVRNIFDSRYTKGSFGTLDPRTYYVNVEYKF